MDDLTPSFPAVLEYQKEINNKMKKAHELLEEENSNVIALPITHRRGPMAGDWLWKLPVGTNFLSHSTGMYLTEYTVMHKKEYCVLLREDTKEGKLDLSIQYWVYSYIFSQNNSLEVILNAE